jgi:hypothetical protein
MGEARRRRGAISRGEFTRISSPRWREVRRDLGWTLNGSADAWRSAEESRQAADDTARAVLAETVRAAWLRLNRLLARKR